MPDLGLKASPNVFLIEGGGGGMAVEVPPFRGVSHATHLLLVSLLRIIHISHSHSLEDFLNCWPKELADDAAAFEPKLNVEVVLAVLVELPFLGVSHATHFVDDALLRIMHVSHSHSFKDFLN